MRPRCRNSLLTVWAQTVRRFGRRRAIAEAAAGRDCTFGELDVRATEWAKRHAAMAESVRQRLVVCAVPNGIGWFEVFLGLRKLGAIVVPLDPGEPPAAQRRVAESLRAAAWWDGAQLLPLPGARRFRDPRLCLVKLTSGTTGAPRPLFFTDDQMLADGTQVAGTMGIRATDLNYALIPLGHSYGLGNLVFPLLAHGVPLVCGSAPLPHAIAADFATWRPTVFPSVPAVWRALAASELSTAALGSLRVAISAGAPLPSDVAAAFAARFGRRLHSFYGSSETGGIAYDRTGAATLAGGVGRAMRGVTLTPLRGQRLRIASAAVFTRGNRRRERGFGAWIPPDLARIDARGVTLLGRRGATVKIAGRRVNLAAMAARLRTLPGVRDAWVGISEGSEPALGAAVATDRPLADLRSELRADTAAWRIPKHWAVFGAFPLTPRGKTDTRALHEAVFRRRDHVAAAGT